MLLRVITVSVAFIVLTGLFSGCSFQKQDLLSEEVHHLCEQYHNDIEWNRVFYNNEVYMPLDRFISFAMKRDDLQLCSCEITKAEIQPKMIEDDTRTFIDLTFEIKEVYIGNPIIARREIKQRVYQESKEASHLVGNKYLFFVVGAPNQYKNLRLYTPWGFLITEGNVLVNTYGCQVEELNRPSYQMSMEESRSYTGQNLYCFLNAVGDEIEAWRAEQEE